MGGLLGRALKNTVNRAVGNAVTGAVSNAVERKITDAVANPLNKAVNQAADTIAPTQPQQPYQQPNAQQNAQAQASAAQLGGIFASLSGAAQSFAGEAAKNMKICPGCENPCGAEMKFCNQCGTPLPEMTVAQGAVCQDCGMQNGLGTRFCAGCGTKLPGALAEEAASQARNEAALSRWEALLPQYPRWNQGGSDISIEECGIENGWPAYGLHISGQNMPAALAQYCQLLKANGFVTAGEYPTEGSLYKRVNGMVYNFSSENAFDGGMDNMSVYFCVREPHGGFDYKKPEPKPKTSWKDVLGI